MGYVIVDNRAAGEGFIEYDTVQCQHCQGVIKKIKRRHTGLYCMPCGGPVHDTPYCASRCRSFKREFDVLMKNVEMRRRSDAFAAAARLQKG